MSFEESLSISGSVFATKKKKQKQYDLKKNIFHQINKITLSLWNFALKYVYSILLKGTSNAKINTLDIYHQRFKHIQTWEYACDISGSNFVLSFLCIKTTSTRLSLSKFTPLNLISLGKIHLAACNQAEKLKSKMLCLLLQDSLRRCESPETGANDNVHYVYS